MHRQAEGLAGRPVLDLDLLEMGKQRRAAIPRRAHGGRDHVVAIAGRERDGHQRLEAERPGELGECVADVDEALLVEADAIDLVDRQHDVADAEQRDDVGVAAGLGEDAVLGIDQQDGEIGGRGAGRHVAGVLDVAGGIGDDEAAVLGGEIAIGDVDGDALLALGGEPVDDQGIVDLLAGGAEAFRIGGERGELVLEEELGIVQQAADERRLAVIDAAAGEEAQQALVAAGHQELGEGGRVGGLVHQK